MPLISMEQAVAALEADDVIAMPTETVYGLAGRIDSEAALKKIFAVKARPFFDPLIVHVENVTQAKTLAQEWPKVFDVLAKAFWPGPLTLVVPKTAKVNPLITSGLETVAVRCPDHSIALQLIRNVGTPLAAPSANKFGRTSPTAASHVIEEFENQVGVLDGGPCRVGVESTVLTYKNGKLAILRPGGVTREALAHELQRAGMKVEIETETSSNATPGHLPHHYQPECPVILLNGKSWSPAMLALVENQLGRRFDHVHEIIFPAEAHEAARRLYQDFRHFGKIPSSLIVIEKKHDQNRDEWEAIWDRVGRAASLKFS